MSYILDALKKSEQERKRGNVPDIKSIHANDAPGDSGNKRNWWPLLIGIAILLPVAAIVAVLVVDSGKSSLRSTTASHNNESKSRQSSLSSDTKKATSKPSNASSKQVAKPEAIPIEKPKTQVAQTQNTPQPRVVFSETELDAGNADSPGSKPRIVNKIAIPVNEVPESIRRQIPSISFAGHVYSSVSNRRSVMINGKKMREGDAVTSELILKEITPTGAEFTFQGYRFKLGALTDWSSQ